MTEDARSVSSNNPSAAIEVLGDDGTFAAPLAHQQARLWFLTQAAPADVSYHMAYRLTLQGPLDVPALGRALEAVVARHEVLRTRFLARDGEPRQVVSPYGRVRLEHADVSALPAQHRRGAADDLTGDLVRHPFDLEAGALLRALLIRDSATMHALVVVMHHIIGDGWSHAVLVRDLCAFYRVELADASAPRPAPLRIQYADYAVRQHDASARAHHETQREAWRTQLARVQEPLRLPRDLLLTPTTRVGATVERAVPGASIRRLRAALGEEATLLSAILLATYEATLARFADQDSFPVGIAVANRSHVETEDLIGFFVNTLILPSDTEGNPAFADLVRRTQHRLLDLQSSQESSLVDILSSLGASGSWGKTPLVQALFVLQNAQRPRFELPGVDVEVERLQTETSKFELSLLATEGPDSIALEFEYDARSFARETIDSLADSFLDILDTALGDPRMPCLTMPLVGRARASISVGLHVPELRGDTVADLVLAQARKRPNAPALEWQGGAMTYAALSHAAHAYAAGLRLRRLGDGDVVAMVLPRGPELVVTTLGILMAGAAYCPVDPSLPDPYIADLLERLQPAVVVSASPRLAHGGPQWIASPELDGRADETSPGAHKSLVAVAPSSLAYVLHTSGSTGVPKGVLVEHDGLTNVCQWIAAELRLGPGDRCLMKTPLTFDAAARELYPTLISGATLVITDPDAHRDIPRLRAMLDDRRATVLHCVPSQLAALLREGPLPASIRGIMCGGERLPVAVAAQALARGGLRLWNVYGPTEATVDATAFPVPADFAGPELPIGRPIPNMTAVVLDRSGRPAPLGAVGEIYLAGPGVARGYARSDGERPAFSRDPDSGERRYATGDRGRINAHGIVEYLGRRDGQLKRDGVRIEPATLTRVLRGHPAIGDAHIVAVPGSDATRPQLVAAIVPPRDVPQTAIRSGRDEANAWRAVFDTSYASLSLQDAPEHNTHGWVQSVSRDPLPVDEVVAQADEAASRVLRWHPARILELGCGTGLLAFRLAAACQRYHGVDAARQVIAYVDHHARARGLTNLRLSHGTMEAWSPEPGVKYDAIVLHSVVQYLSGHDALGAVLARFAPYLDEGGFFFIGDVRHAALTEVAAIAQTLADAAPSMPAVAILTSASLRVARDGELCLDPGFFVEWAAGRRDPRFAPPLVEPKTSRGTCELIRYRFDVTLSRAAATSPPPTTRIRRLGWQRNRLIAEPVEIASGLRALPPTTAAGLVRSETAVTDLLSPAEALARHAASTTAQVLCRLGDTPDRFELCEIGSEVPLFEVATHLGATAVGVRPRATSEVFRRFLEATDDLSEFLRARLPHHELPDRVLRLPALPLTAHGKLDSSSLRALAEAKLLTGREREASASAPTATEAAVCEVFTAVIGEAFRRDDDFFLMGGHSLLATRACARLSKRFGIELPLRAIFEQPTARALADVIEHLVAQSATLSTIPRRANPAAATPTPAQQRLWFIEELGTAATVYNIVQAIRLDGVLDALALDRAVGDLLTRHAPLRSRFFGQDGHLAVTVVSSRPHGHLEWIRPGESLSLDAAVATMRTEASRRFHLSQDALVRILLCRLDSATERPSHLLCVVAHHIVADGWSLMRGLGELAGLYRHRITGEAQPPPALDVDYYDVAAWQAACVQKGTYDKSIGYWVSELRGAPTQISLPVDHRAPEQRSWQGKKRVFEIPAALARRVKLLAASAQATDFMALLAAFQVLLHKMSGVDDLVIGTMIANRQRPEFEPLIGMLVNPLALRLRLDANDSFRDVLRRARATSVSAFEHQDAPFELVLERLDVDRRMNYQAVFQVLFVMQNTPEEAFTLHGLDCERVPIETQGAMFDLSLEVRDAGSAMRAVLEYSTDLFRPETAELIIARFLLVLDRLTDSPDAAISQLSIVAPEEHARVMAFAVGPRIPGPTGETLPGRILEVAALDRDRLAIIDGSARYSYGDLARRIHRTVTQLEDAGVRRGMRVALHLERGPAVAWASLGVQLLGAMPVYINVELPLVRKQVLIRTIGARVGLAAGHHMPVDAVIWIDVDSELSPTVGGDVRLPRMVCTPDDAAYATFTSGSSGTPNTVVVSQRAITSRIRANNRVLRALRPSDRVAHLYRFDYDGGIMTLFWSLCGGATLVFLPLDLVGEPRQLSAALTRESITVLDAIPTLLQDLFGREHGPYPSLELVLTGGDVCPNDLPAQVLRSADVVFANQYGPCEAVVNATTWTARSGDPAAQPNIGRPLPDADVFVTDPEGRLCAIGIPGELSIGGPALADGYLDDAALTARCFVERDLGDGVRRRLYHSGDRARWTVNGELEFLGRVDRQVKLRGMRTDPSEVEAQLRLHPDVSDAYVLVEGEADQRHLVACVGLAAAGAVAPDHSHDRVDEWRRLFTRLYHPSQARTVDPVTDLAGWDDTATGRPIPDADMRAWLSATVDRLGCRTGDTVLEVGAGLGLIALRVAAQARSYVATDVSEAAMARLRAAANRLGINNLRCVAVEASQLGQLTERFDLIILNSVVQYFPSASYLKDVLETCGTLLAESGRIFVGDVRNYWLAPQFHAEVERIRSPDTDTAQIAYRAMRRWHHDEELHLAPAFFDDLRDGAGSTFAALPLVKTRAGTSELARYRYDVWLSRDVSRALPATELTWGERVVSLDALGALLTTRVDTIVACTGIPDCRLTVAGEQPDDVVALGESLGYSVLLMPGRAATPAHFDAVFLPAGTTRFAGGTPSVNRSRTSGATGETSNDPLFGRRAARLRPQLISLAEERLAQHLRPHRYVILPRLPVVPGGKLDIGTLRGLARLHENAIEPSGERDLPMAAMIDLWRMMLRSDAVTASSDFFAIGGHSLLAARLVAAIRREFGVSLPVIKVFECRTPTALTDEIGRRRGLSAQPDLADKIPTITWTHCTDTTVATSEAQRAILSRLAQLPAGAGHLGLTVRVHSALDGDAFQAALEALTRQHALLRRRLATPDTLVTAAPERVVFHRGTPADAIRVAVEPLDPRLRLWSIQPFRDAQDSVTVAARMHPACFDGDAVSLLLDDLASALVAVLEQRTPLAGRMPTDYAALTRWERSAAGEAFLGRARQRWCPEAVGLASARYARINASPATHAVTWGQADTERVDQIAVRFGVTTCAVMLGVFAMHVARVQSSSPGASIEIECPVSTRHSLRAEGVLGPFAIDVPLRFPAAAARSLPEAAQEASAQIARLFDVTLLPPVPRHDLPRFAFSYQDRPLAQAPGFLQASSVAHVSPLWARTKLSIHRGKGALTVRVTTIDEMFDVPVFINGLLDTIRRCELT